MVAGVNFIPESVWTCCKKNVSNETIKQMRYLMDRRQSVIREILSYFLVPKRHAILHESVSSAS